MRRDRDIWQRIGGSSLLFMILLIITWQPLPAHAELEPQFQEFPAPLYVTPPMKIVAGPGGDVWFTETNTGFIGRFSVKTRQITTYQTNNSMKSVLAIADGGDNTLWYLTGSGVIERIFSDTGNTNPYYSGFQDVPYDLARGGDNNLWYVTAKAFGRIDSSGNMTEFGLPQDALNGNVTALTAGPDGNLWYSVRDGQIGKVTPQGDSIEYPITSTGTNVSQPISLVLGSDHNLWFLDIGTNKVGRITTQGNVEEYDVPQASSTNDWRGMTASQNGQLWFTDPVHNQLITMNFQGTFTTYPIPTPNSNLSDITIDTHGMLWFSETGGNRIASFQAPTIKEQTVTVKDKSNTRDLFQEFVVPENPVDPAFILPGPRGDLWFSETNTNTIGRITTDGTLLAGYDTYEKYQGYQATGDMARGKDGNLWFVEDGTLERITPDGKITAYPPPDPYGMYSSLSANSDGNVWFLEGSARYGKITPQGKITDFSFPPGSHAYKDNPYGTITHLTAGPDGNLWFTEPYANTIGRITPQGKLKEYNIPPGKALYSYHYGSFPTFITSGPDGNLWFLEASYNRLSSITPQGDFQDKITNESLGNAIGMTFGRDGNLWLAEFDRIVRITLKGDVTEYPQEPNSNIEHITSGPDGNLWFTNSGTNKIGKITLS